MGKSEILAFYQRLKWKRMIVVHVRGAKCYRNTVCLVRLLSWRACVGAGSFAGHTKVGKAGLACSIDSG